MGCAHCGMTTLTKPQFVAELAKHGIVADPYNVDSYKSSGAAAGYGAYEAAIGNVEAKYNEIQKGRAFKCRGCGSLYCMACLLRYAPSHPNGGKACTSCGGAFAEG